MASSANGTSSSSRQRRRPMSRLECALGAGSCRICSRTAQHCTSVAGRANQNPPGAQPHGGASVLPTHVPLDGRMCEFTNSQP